LPSPKHHHTIKTSTLQARQTLTTITPPLHPSRPRRRSTPSSLSTTTQPTTRQQPDQDCQRPSAGIPSGCNPSQRRRPTHRSRRNHLAELGSSPKFRSSSAKPCRRQNAQAGPAGQASDAAAAMRNSVTARRVPLPVAAIHPAREQRSRRSQCHHLSEMAGNSPTWSNHANVPTHPAKLPAALAELHSENRSTDSHLAPAFAGFRCNSH